MSPRPQPVAIQPVAVRRVAIVGGGLSGVTAAWQLATLARAGAPIEATLFEASPRFGGILETVHRDGFTIECGPDAWLTEKPAARQLALDLGLGGQLLASNDATRVTYLVQHGRLEPLPPGLRLMVPTDLAAVQQSPLFSPAARAAYAAEPARARALQAAAPARDESVATFVERHFGPEVLASIAAPLLSGVFGGDVAQLSVRAVMPAFVQMERDHGSLILALQSQRRAFQNQRQTRQNPRPDSGLKPHPDFQPQSIFTTLSSGLSTLIIRMLEDIPAAWLRPSTPVTGIARSGRGWLVSPAAPPGRPAPAPEAFDALILALPAHHARQLLQPVVPAAAALLDLEASSAILIAFAFASGFPLPPGFGFLVPAGEASSLLAATFTDQKFALRAPPGKRLLRAFFGGPRLAPDDPRSDPQLAVQALAELEAILGPLPAPQFHLVRRWPRSLPQYAVGHLDRMDALDALVAAQPHLHLLGSALRGVGLPDLIHSARTAARSASRALTA